MKRQRRTFSPEFKQETVHLILSGRKDKIALSSEHNISIPLLERWINDFIAKNKKIEFFPQPIERRKDYQSVQELKAKIADLYMQIDILTKSRTNHSSVSMQLSRS